MQIAQLIIENIVVLAVAAGIMLEVGHFISHLKTVKK
jgi:hypothetical protein